MTHVTSAQADFARRTSASIGARSAVEPDEVFMYGGFNGMEYRWLVDGEGNVVELDFFDGGGAGSAVADAAELICA